MTELCDLARKYGTDKVLYYTPFYHELFKDRRESVRKVLEIGIGSPETMLPSVCRMGLTTYTPGASLFMWRDYFPNAEIYALDKDHNIFVNEERIHSFYVDQDDAGSFTKVPLCVGHDFDLIVDDGQHTYESQLRTALCLTALLSHDGTYIIEDVGSTWAGDLIDNIPLSCALQEFGEARVLVVTP